MIIGGIPIGGVPIHPQKPPLRIRVIRWCALRLPAHLVRMSGLLVLPLILLDWHQMLAVDAGLLFGAIVVILVREYILQPLIRRRIRRASQDWADHQLAGDDDDGDNRPAGIYRMPGTPVVNRREESFLREMASRLQQPGNPTDTGDKAS